MSGRALHRTSLKEVHGTPKQLRVQESTAEPNPIGLDVVGRDWSLVVDADAPASAGTADIGGGRGRGSIGRGASGNGGDDGWVGGLIIRVPVECGGDPQRSGRLCVREGNVCSFHMVIEDSSSANLLRFRQTKPTRPYDSSVNSGHGLLVVPRVNLHKVKFHTQVVVLRERLVLPF
eukprot:2686313-Pleurochrysis_carterae.AAC.3